MSGSRESYRNPIPTVDVIIEIRGGESGGQPGIVLIERVNEPHGWALPGGFVDYGETLARAARREAKEETGLDVELVDQLYTYSDPKRDPRQHTLSTVFIARADGRPVGGDDAAAARVFDRAHLPETLAFDHGQILDDYFSYRDSGKRPPPSR